MGHAPYHACMLPLRLVNLLTAAMLAGCASPAEPRLHAVPADEQARTIEALRPPKRERPIIAVVGANAGTETTDFLVPFSVLARSGVAEVTAVSTEPGAMTLMPALRVEARETIAQFDARVSDGADYVVVPALHDPETPAVVDWVKRQHAAGATIVGICSGVKVLAQAGLLGDRKATGHWYDLDDLVDENPSMRWIPHRRYVADRGVVTTTGISASLPVSLALVEAIAGATRARELADELGVSTWDASHDSDAFGRGADYIWTVGWNTMAFWGHETIAVPVHGGIDEIALAFTADAWSRTYRSEAFSTAADATVTTAHGLVLWVDDPSGGAGGDLRLEPVRDSQPARALDDALQAIEARYGQSTGAWVARQLEYPR
jgi:putative intracellular protease/amidase